MSDERKVVSMELEKISRTPGAVEALTEHVNETNRMAQELVAHMLKIGSESLAAAFPIDGKRVQVEVIITKEKEGA